MTEETVENPILDAFENLVGISNQLTLGHKLTSEILLFHDKRLGRLEKELGGLYLLSITNFILTIVALIIILSWR